MRVNGLQGIQSIQWLPQRTEIVWINRATSNRDFSEMKISLPVFKITVEFALSDLVVE